MSNAARDLSDALASTVEKSGPSVVQVQARPRTASTGIVWSSDGVIVSADHTVSRDEDIEVGLPDGKTAPASLAGRDPGTDLAVLRVDATGLAAAAWSGLEGLKVGHLVLALARPGRSARARLGIVSALGDTWRTPAGGRIDRYLQPDVPLQPGFSGSLLVDTAGRTLGMNTAGILRGLALTVPATTLRRVVESVLAHGSVRRGYLGVGAYPVRLPGGFPQEPTQESGLVVVAVQPGSPAEQAGLLLGDILLSLDGRPTGHLSELHALLDEERVGTEVTVRFLRAGKVQELRLTIGAR